MNKITKSMTIAEIFEIHPDKILELSEVMTNFGLHCVGCFASGMETLEQGFKGHGYPKDQLTKLIKELNKVINRKNVRSGIRQGC